jgi:hypothetical protein
MVKSKEVVDPAFVGEVEAALVYLTVPGNLKYLIPGWVKEADFSNTPKSERQMAPRSDKLFQVAQARMDGVLGDLAGAGFLPSEVFYLNRDGGARRVRITCKRFGAPLTLDQVQSLIPLTTERIWDVMAHRTAATRNIPWEHISINAGRPDHAPEGGFEAVRVVEGRVSVVSLLNTDELRKASESIIGLLESLQITR